MTNPAEIIPTDSPRTDIYRDEFGEIIRLDSFSPEVGEREVFIGIDLAKFAKIHDLPTGITVNQHIDDSAGSVVATVMEYPVAPDLAPKREGTLEVNQRILTIGRGGIGVAASTYNSERAAQVLKAQNS